MAPCIFTKLRGVCMIFMHIADFVAVLRESTGVNSVTARATAPNAIAYGSGFVRSKDMLREGLWLDIVSVLVVCAVCWVVLV